MAAVAAASAELLIIGWYIFRVLLQTLPSAPVPGWEQRLGARRATAADDQPRLLATYAVFLECCIYWVGFAFRNPPGTQPIARSEVFRYSLQKLAYTVSRTGRQVLGERRQRAPN
ncbi:neuronatin isoform X1 [Nycticebus coucang]|uniref:neuronatin isoform X1 n=1 Tax=Nycticebus coucang TaxID=9470 RepID=UPI00234DE8CE|nr:neuronatin isoform X1 [Nycticebus coucang]